MEDNITNEVPHGVSEDITTLDVAEDIAALIEDAEMGTATALKAETGRIVLSVELLDANNQVRTFRFLGGEVSR